MTHNQAKQFARDLNFDGFQSRVEKEYSGRGMGRTSTAAVVTDAEELDAGRIFATITEDDEHPTRLRVDQMGKQIIYY